MGNGSILVAHSALNLTNSQIVHLHKDWLIFYFKKKEKELAIGAFIDTISCTRTKKPVEVIAVSKCCRNTHYDFKIYIYVIKESDMAGPMKSKSPG